jgi:hypothetical protein
MLKSRASAATGRRFQGKIPNIGFERDFSRDMIPLRRVSRNFQRLATISPMVDRKRAQSITESPVVHHKYLPKRKSTRPKVVRWFQFDPYGRWVETALPGTLSKKSA